MKNIFLGMVLFMTVNLFAQVGIGTSDPQATLVYIKYNIEKS